jgi:hypothetical protein
VPERCALACCGINPPKKTAANANQMTLLLTGSFFIPHSFEKHSK